MEYIQNVAHISAHFLFVDIWCLLFALLYCMIEFLKAQALMK